MNKLQIEVKLGIRRWSVEIDINSLNDYERIVYLLSKLVEHEFDNKSTKFYRS